MDQWYSILPPILAILIAIWKKEVVLALTVGIWLAEVLLVLSSSPMPSLAPAAVLKALGLGFVGMMERCVSVFQSEGNTRVLLFGLIVGALLELMRRSGGVNAFVVKLTNLGLTKSPRRVGALASLIGMAIFVETSMSVLAAGVVSQKLFDRFRMSRARLAFIVDSTCAPISVLAIFNGWGAYILGLLDPYELESSVSVLVASIAFNFYPILIIGLVWYTVLSTKVHGPMKRVEVTQQVPASQGDEEPATKAHYMLVPLLFLIGGMVFFMWLTGKGNLLEGSGSRSVLWAVTLATIVCIGILGKNRVFPYARMVDLSYQGIGKLVPVVTIMLLSFAIGASCRALGTGPFVASFVGSFLPVFLVAPLLFISAALISFTTGTSWGTFAILVPVGIPLGVSMGLPLPFVLAAVLGGGVFGDHCSPISDTTILSSLASGCDHLEHVRTQLPYALTAGTATVLVYLVIGIFI